MKWVLIAGVPVAAVLLGAEIFSDSPGLDVQVSAIAAPVPAAPADPAPDSMDGLAARILARPLFAPTRRPERVPVTQGTAGAKLPRLSGLISGPGGGYAIFQPEAAAPSVVVGEGATLGQWTVQTITAETVTISHDNQRLVLHPIFADAPADANNEKPKVSIVPAGNHFWAGRVGAGMGVAETIQR